MIELNGDLLNTIFHSINFHGEWGAYPLNQVEYNPQKFSIQLISTESGETPHLNLYPA